MGFGYLVALQIGVPSVLLWSEVADYDPDTIDVDAMAALRPGGCVISEDDHCWHEYTGVVFSSFYA